MSYLKLEQDRLKLRQDLLDRQTTRGQERRDQIAARKKETESKATKAPSSKAVELNQIESDAPTLAERAAEKAFRSRVNAGLVKATKEFQVDTESATDTDEKADGIGLVRRPEPWESVSSFMITVPAGTEPKEIYVKPPNCSYYFMSGF